MVRLSPGRRAILICAVTLALTSLGLAVVFFWVAGSLPGSVPPRLVAPRLVGDPPVTITTSTPDEDSMKQLLQRLQTRWPTVVAVLHIGEDGTVDSMSPSLPGLAGQRLPETNGGQLQRITQAVREADPVAREPVRSVSYSPRELVALVRPLRAVIVPHPTMGPSARENARALRDRMNLLEEEILAIVSAPWYVEKGQYLVIYKPQRVQLGPLSLPGNRGWWRSVSFALGVAAWLLFAMWTFADAWWRHDAPLPWGLLALLTGLVGVAVYLVSRRYAPQLCPGCGRPVRSDFVVCPHCGGQLSLKCASCGRALDPHWSHCPYCGATPTDGPTSTDNTPSNSSPSPAPAAP